MGKTTLLAELRHKAEDEGFRVRQARGELLERGFPWGVVRRLFERAGGRGTGAAELARIPLGGSEAETGSLFASLHGLYWLAVELAQERPLALFVDDAHWVDMLSMRWLAYLAARISEDPMLLVIAARPAPREDDEGAWPSLMANGRVRELAPLEDAATANLIEDVLGEAPDPAFAALCRRLTAGNPLLLVELARGIEKAGIPLDASGVQMLQETPRTVLTPTVALRLRRLGHESLEVARAIAVLGSHATPLRIATLSELDAAATSTGLERLAGDRLIRVEPSIEFLHPLVRTAAYEDLKPPARGAWHARAARLLSSEPTDPDVVAGHLLLADASGDQSFVALLRSAARRAQARAAPATAANYLSRALAEPPRESDRAAVLLERAYAELANRPAHAVEDFQKVLSRRIGSPVQVDARIGLAHALIRGAGFADAVDVLEEGLQTLNGTEAALKDALLAALLNTARWDIAVRPRCRSYVEALQRRHAAGKPLTPELHANLALELLAAGRHRDDALQHANAALVNANVASAHDAMWVSLVVTPLACSGEVARSLEVCSAVITSARSEGQRSVLSVALAASAFVRLWAGDARGAIVDGEDALANADDPMSTCFALTFLAEAHIYRGDFKAAWSLLDAHGVASTPVPAFWPFPWLRVTRGWLRFQLGDPHAALDDLQTAGKLILRYGFRPPVVTPWRIRAAMVWAALGNRERGARLAELEVRNARVWGEPRILATTLTSAALLADGDRQLEMLQEAIEITDEAERVVPRIDALCAMGAALRRSGHRRLARDYLIQAQHLAHESGALGALNTAREELLAAGGRPRRLAVRGIDALTPSETRVARLAAEGRSNPEIAQLLFITRRTVETHLTSAYSKLGITGRDALREALT